MSIENIQNLFFHVCIVLIQDVQHTSKDLSTTKDLIGYNNGITAISTIPGSTGLLCPSRDYAWSYFHVNSKTYLQR